MIKMNVLFVLVSTFAIGCIAEEDPQPTVEEIEAESSTCRVIQHFTYNYGGSTYRWDVTRDTEGRWFVDERRIGGGFYRQYRVSPRWSWCPAANETLTLTSSAGSMTGIHVCLPDGRQEFHGDYQRLLVPSSPAVTYNCQP